MNYLTRFFDYCLISCFEFIVAAVDCVAAGVLDVVSFSVLPNAKSECCRGMTAGSQALGSKSVQRVRGTLSVLKIDRRPHIAFTPKSQIRCDKEKQNNILIAASAEMLHAHV